MKVINVSAALIIKDGRLFATQRGYGKHKDYWEFPGGKIEPGENAEDALVREIKEELNTVVETVELFCKTEYDYPDFHLSMKCYLCRVVTGDLELLEHEASAWLSADELTSVNWLPADFDVLGKLKESGLLTSGEHI